MADFVSQFLFAFATLFVVMDPFSTMPVFIAMTKKFSESERAATVTKATLVAGILVFAFLFFGTDLLRVMSISVASFQIAGGLVLGLLGLQLVLDFSLGKESAAQASSVALVIATPLLTGPGVLTAVILLNAQQGLAVTGAAALASLAASWLFIRYAYAFKRALGERGDNFMHILSKIMGLLVVALAVEFVRKGFGIA
jgi:multiple antibiotic resistance protein